MQSQLTSIGFGCSSLVDIFLDQYSLHDKKSWGKSTTQNIFQGKYILFEMQLRGLIHSINNLSFEENQDSERSQFQENM